MSKQPQAAPPLTPVGETFELVPGALYECVGHQVDRNGKLAEVPGRYLGPAGRKRKPRAAPTAAPVAAPPPIPNTHAGQTAAVALTPTTAHAPAVSSVPTTPAPAALPRQRKARGRRAARGDYRRFRQKPPPLVIVNEPWTAGEWGALILTLALVVAGLWLWNVRAEQQKWEMIEGAARAVRAR